MKRQLILAIDFDGTIVEDNWPNIGNIRTNAREIINILHDEFNIVTILWTCREGIELQKAKIFLKEQDVHIDYFNEDPPWFIRHWKQMSPKIFADFYIDDKALGGIIDWEEIFERITQFKYSHSYKYI